MVNKLFSDYATFDDFYSDQYKRDADYTTNAPSYGDDLARKQHLLKLLAERVWSYDVELAKRILQWDKNLEEFDENVHKLLVEWLNSGVLADIINNDVFGMKADQSGLPVSAKRFGVVADGVTDDTVSWQAAIDANVPLAFPEGQSVITSLKLKGTTRIYGLGSYKSVFLLKGAGTAIDLSSEEPKINVELKDFAIIGENVNGSMGINAKYFTNNSVIDNVRIEGCWKGIKIVKSWYAQFYRLRLRNNLLYNLEINSPSTSEQCNNLAFNECTIHGAVYNVWIDGNAPSSVISFNDCAIEAAKRTGVYARSCSPLAFTGCYFERNFADGSATVTPTYATPIDIDVDTYSVRDNVVIRNCYFSRKNDFIPSTQKISILVGINVQITVEDTTFQCNTSAYIDIDIYSISTKKPYIRSISQDGYALKNYEGVLNEYPVSVNTEINLRYTNTNRMTFLPVVRGVHYAKFIPYATINSDVDINYRVIDLATGAVIITLVLPKTLKQNEPIELRLGNQVLNKVYRIEAVNNSLTDILGALYIIRKDTR